MYALSEIQKTVGICCVQGEPKMVSITNIDKLALCVGDEPHLFDFVFV